MKVYFKISIFKKSESLLYKIIKFDMMAKTIVGFLSRPHGFAVLTALTKSSDYKVLKIYTHMLNPKSQDPTRSKRMDFDLFTKECLKNNIEIVPIDSKLEIINCPNCDFIIEVSWRYIIPQEVVSKAKVGAFGIHRGKLPDYAGAEPIKQALLKEEKEIVLSAHHLAPKIDDGDTIHLISHRVNYNAKQNLEQNVQRLRDEITPLFPILTFKTLHILSKE